MAGSGISKQGRNKFQHEFGIYEIEFRITLKSTPNLDSGGTNLCRSSLSESHPAISPCKN